MEEFSMAYASGLIEQYRQLHASTVYGNTSVKTLRYLRPEIALLRPRSIIDYGCGQSTFLDELRLDYDLQYVRYDPAIPEYSRKPSTTADLLVNIDVLEHIEENDLDDVIAELAVLGQNAIIVVDTKPASTVLPDGRNAHVTIRPPLWWREKLLRHFPALYGVATVRRSRAGFKTWPRGLAKTMRYLGLRASEDAHHYMRRINW
jgi:hypothetical protein